VAGNSYTNKTQHSLSWGLTVTVGSWELKNQNLSMSVYSRDHWSAVNTQTKVLLK